ncbi:MAG: hypothetical protein V4531_14485 [Actinomycetota bacterium]
MSRPTNLSKYEEAERWMTDTFGQGMPEYLAAVRRDPISVCVVEVDKVVRKSGVQNLLVRWRDEDSKSKAGRRAILTPTAALSLILLQMRLKRAPLITELSETFLQLSSTQRTILGLTHDSNEDRVYDRIWAGIQRLIALVDEFPGRRDKRLTETEFVATINARDAADCAMRRERLFSLSNALLEGSRQCLPKELLDRSDGNVALDATFIPLYGKTGNRSPKNLRGDRLTANPDGGWYQREGSHGAVTHVDAAVFKKEDPTSKVKGTSKANRNWGIEAEIARMTANFLEGDERFPLLTVGVSFHVPGVVSGEGLRIADSLLERGHKSNLFIVDRAYSNGRYGEYAVPLRLRGFKHVFNYRDADLGEQAFDPRGFIQISGAWYLDTLPQVLRNADKVVLAARNKYEATKQSLHKDITSSKDQIAKVRAMARKERDQANDLYRKQCAQRAKSLLRPKGHMAADWTRRYLVPIDSPDYAKWKARPGTHQGVTVTMKRPAGDEAEPANAGGLKHEQYYVWGSDEWCAANGMRNGVESVNRNLKRSQYEDIADAEKRAVRGNTFTYLVVAIGTVVENLRKIVSFYKNQLRTKTLSPKNNRLPGSYWQPADQSAESEDFEDPPR